MNPNKAKLDTLEQIIDMADEAMLGGRAKRKGQMAEAPAAAEAPPAEAMAAGAPAEDDLDPEMARKLAEMYDEEFAKAQQPTAIAGVN